MPDKMAHLTKNQQHITAANDNFFGKETHLIRIIQ